MNEPSANPAQPAKSGGKPESKSSLKWIIIGVAAAAVAGVGAWKFGPMLTGGGTHEIVEPGETPKPAEAEPLQFGEVVELDDIVINPAGSRRVFMVKVTLEVVDKEKSREVEKRQALLRDNLITLFASQPLEVLIDIKYRQAFRARVKKIMDFQLGEGVVSRVFFEKWVFQ